MRRTSKIGLAIIASTAAVLGATGVANAGGGTGITAVSAGTGYWSDCSGTFVRSSSGIVNETNRVCGTNDSEDLATFGAPVYVQFRPLTGIPNPACDPNGLIEVINYPGGSDQATLGKWFISSTTYNACFYYVNPQLASGTVDSASQVGVTHSLGVPGRYRIDVSGTWQNDGVSTEDAEFTSVNGTWSDVEDGYNHDPYFLGEGFGDLMVNGGFVNWGAFSPSHAYSLNTTLGTSVQLNIFDGDSTGGNTTPNSGWYGDNVGSLSYTVTYLGQ